MQPSFHECWDSGKVLSSLTRSTFLSRFMFCVLGSQTKKHSGGKMLVSMCLCLIHDFPVTSFPFSELQKASDHVQLSLPELCFHCSLKIEESESFPSKRYIEMCRRQTYFIPTTCCKCCTKEISPTILLFFLNIVMKCIIPCSIS